MNKKGVAFVTNKNEDNVEGFIALVAGITLFIALTSVGSVENFIQSQPIVVIVGSIVLFFYRKKITKKLEGKK